MSDSNIEIRGAREHNLKNVSVRIPKNKLVVFTGVSGSGKSSLAFDTIYAEGHRRYAESLSSFARQFLGQMEKPKYDAIRGLAPTIAIEQKAASSNPRSTVGTITEVYDYLRVLFARLGVQHCPKCGRPSQAQTVEQIRDAVLALGEGERVELFAPIVRNRKGEFRDVLEAALAKGFHRTRIDGKKTDLGEAIPRLDKKSKHDIDLLVDRFVLSKSDRARLTDSLEAALAEGAGTILVVGKEERLFSRNRACVHCHISFEDLSPQSFSFNSPIGACLSCNGLGTKPEMDPDLLVPDADKTIEEGAIVPWATAMVRGEGWTADEALNVLRVLKVSSKKRWRDIPKVKRNAILFGKLGREEIWEGLAHQMMRRFQQSTSEMAKDYYLRFLSEKACGACKGERLKPESAAVRISGVSLPELTQRSIAEVATWLAEIRLTPHEREIASELLREIKARTTFLLDVGLEYLTFARSAGTLSGGETQRIRLASQIGSELTGVIYVLDEPSIGLHQRDNERLLGTLLRLRDLGNSVIVVEHDEDTIRAADWVCDFGPGAGIHGGAVVSQGTPKALERDPKSPTGAYLSGRKRIEIPRVRRKGSGEAIVVKGAREHNLKGIDVRFPLGTLTCVTGVSGAGKSTLVSRILLPAAMRHLHESRVDVGAHDQLLGLEAVDKIIAIDQQPIGRTPRSNPVTYTKVFDGIRNLFAQTKEARAYGYDAGRFSFNVAGGRCDACGGDGVRKVEMHFLADVYVTCESCNGKRFNEATLRVRYKDKHIADVLDLSVEEAIKHFAVHRDIARGLTTLADVGLGYMKLGQPSPTLSGGEAQRIKLARELSKVSTSKTLYVLDEPTTGLHFEDIERLLGVLYRFVDAGNTVVVIEHNLDVIKCADWVIDLGPDGGDRGGRVIAEGTPEAVAREKKSATGQWLKNVLGAPASRAPRRRGSAGARAQT